MIHRSATSLLLILLVPPISASAETLNLAEFLDEVRKANPGIEAAQSRARALDHRIRPVSTFDDPFVAGGVDEVPFGGNGAMLRFQVSQTIPFPGKLGAKGDAAERRAQAAHSDAETTQRTLIVIATQTYYRTYFNRRALALNGQSREFIEESIASSKARYKTGSNAHHEWIAAKIELGVLEAERLRLQREQNVLRALMNELRGKSAESDFELGNVRFQDPPGDVPDRESLLAGQSELATLQRRSEAAEADEQAAKLSYFPDFVLQGMAAKPTMAGTGQSANWGVMGGISLPVFFWRKQSEQVSVARSEREAALAERRSIQNRLNTEVVDAKEQLKTARDVVALYKRDVIPLTVIAAKNARSGYAARRLPLTQLLEALRVERTQNLELEAAQIDVELAKVRLEHILSSPPTMRIAPVRPTVFGSGPMSSGTVNMGSGMSGPTRRESKPASPGEASPGMGGM